LGLASIERRPISKIPVAGGIRRMALAHVETKDWLVLTAPTAELQTFILRYGDNEKAFPLKDAEELHRAK
jgi:hypothetical protein